MDSKLYYMLHYKQSSKIHYLKEQLHFLHAHAHKLGIYVKESGCFRRTYLEQDIFETAERSLTNTHKLRSPEAFDSISNPIWEFTKHLLQN